MMMMMMMMMMIKTEKKPLKPKNLKTSSKNLDFSSHVRV